MGTAGFIRNSEEESRKELNTVKDVQHLLANEIRSCAQFEQELILEFKEVEEMLHNLKIIYEQMAAIRRLAEERKRLAEELILEANKNSQDIDFDKLQESITMIKHIDSELNPSINKVTQELQRLLVNETHDLYDKAKGQKTKIKRVDQEARKLNAELRIIAIQIQSFDKDIEGIQQFLVRISSERSRRSGPKRKVGFKLPEGK